MQHIRDQQNNRGGRNVHPSMRGGLPMILDMLQAIPSYVYNMGNLESGNKVMLPSSILAQITHNYPQIPHPMIFSVSVMSPKKTVYVGVLEFTAPENQIVLPFWLFQYLHLQEKQIVRLGFVDFLPKASYVKLRPHKTLFIELPNPKNILEMELRNFSCFTKGQTIQIKFLDKFYKLDILDLKPDNKYNTAILLNTDIKTEFAPPLDYVEPKRKRKTENQETKGEGLPFTGKVVRLDGKELHPQ